MGPPGIPPVLPALPLATHTVSADFSIPDGYASYVPRYVAVADGITLYIGADADLEIG